MSTASQPTQERRKSMDAALTKCREYFRNMDVDGDGKLSRPEFLRMIESVGMELDVTQLERAYFAADVNGDGIITFKEFVDAYTGRLTINEAESPNDKGVANRLVPRHSSNILPNTSQPTRKQRNLSDAALISSSISQPRRSVNSLAPGSRRSSDTPVSRERQNSIAKMSAIFVGNQNRCAPPKTIGTISQKELIECCKYFWSSDKDGDGKLSPYEFSELLGTLGMKVNNRDLYKAFKVADADADGLISFNEFSTAYLNKNAFQIVSPGQIKNIPSNSNEMRNGLISRQECFQAMKMLGNDLKENDLDRLMRLINKNNDGKITFNKFYCFLGMNLKDGNSK